MSTYRNAIFYDNNDRFIPSRKRTIEGISNHIFLEEGSYCDIALKRFCNEYTPNDKSNRILYDPFFAPLSAVLSKKAAITTIPVHIECIKMLDAPEVGNDFYLNLIDCSKSGTLAVSLNNRVYTRKHDGTITEIAQTSRMDDCVVSVKYNSDGRFLAMGLVSGHVNIRDSTFGSTVQWNARPRDYELYANNNNNDDFGFNSTLSRNKNRIASLDWFGSNIIAAGSHRGYVTLCDIRYFNSAHTYLEGGHKPGNDICGLKWSLDGNYLASGSNDNSLVIWDMRTFKKLVQIKRFGAVKGLAWSPFDHSIIASGGGDTDRRVMAHDIRYGVDDKEFNVFDFDANNQITSLQWIEGIGNRNRIISTGSSGNVQLWNCKSGEVISTGIGQGRRILCSTVDISNERLITINEGESIGYWDLSFMMKKRKNVIDQQQQQPWFKVIR